MALTTVRRNGSFKKSIARIVRCKELPPNPSARRALQANGSVPATQGIILFVCLKKIKVVFFCHPDIQFQRILSPYLQVQTLLEDCVRHSAVYRTSTWCTLA
jgi:hypothetical protein